MTLSSSQNTVGPIIFANHTARNQLVDEGEVVTFRSNPRTTGDTWWRESRLGPKEGDVRVTKIAEVDPMNTETIAEYCELSGFGSVEDWQNAIQSINGTTPNSGYLYRVTVRE